MEKPTNIGLCPQVVDRILQMDVLPDAKLILFAMISNCMTTATFTQLNKILNCPLDELDSGRMSLFTDRITVAPKMSELKLSLEWELLLEKNRSVQLQAWTNTNYPNDAPNDKPGDTKGS